ncbi:MAG: cytochrome C oxidase subunit IV family protein [Anaerolineaceae bacterium]|nr:cytochrome C oxidase subunit IV family protein [Anaerolineaceae bacterium]
METPQQEEKRRRPNYVGVFVVLAVLTVVEIGITYLPIPRIPVLVPLALLKAALVAMFYMHLRFDRRIFTTLFAFGLLMGFGLLISFTILFGPQLLDIK